MSLQKIALRATCLPILVIATTLLSWEGQPASAALLDKKPHVKILDKAKVYYPAVIKKGARFKKPATLETSKVFDEIPEWKDIKRKKLTEKDAEYHLLLAAANKKFSKAVKKVHSDGSYDIIAESGAIECKNCTAVDCTQSTIDALPTK